MLENFFIATGDESREARKTENMNDVFAESIKANMFGLMASSHFGLNTSQRYAENLIDLIDKSSYSDEQLMKASFESNKIMSILEQYSTGDTVQANWFPHHLEWNELILEAKKETSSLTPEALPEAWSIAWKSEAKKNVQAELEKNTSHAFVVRIYLDIPKTEKDEAKSLGAKWDNNEKYWFTMSDNPHNEKLFEKWQKTNLEQSKIYLNVPKEEKDLAKTLGAKWDNGEKMWYTTSKNPNNQELFEKYSNNQVQKNENNQSEPIYLNVSKEEKDTAKALGAKWDRKAISWYTTNDNPNNERLFSLYSKQNSKILASEQIEKAGELFRDKDFLNSISSLGDSKKIKAAFEIINEAINNHAQTSRQSM